LAGVVRQSGILHVLANGYLYAIIGECAGGSQPSPLPRRVIDNLAHLNQPADFPDPQQEQKKQGQHDSEFNRGGAFTQGATLARWQFPRVHSDTSQNCGYTTVTGSESVKGGLVACFQRYSFSSGEREMKN
jgi:hypothetical protein